jgi:hypothetical protein
MSLRLLAITQHPSDPSTRYRLGVYLPYLAAAQVDVVAQEWPRYARDRLRLVERAEEYDAVLIQRRLIPHRFARILRARSRWLAYDFDDAVMYRDATTYLPRTLLDKLWQFRFLVAQCDAVTAGNDYLADLASNHCRLDRIHVIPTVLDVSRYDVSSVIRRVVPTAPIVGWIGQQSTLTYLERISRPLRQCVQDHPGLMIRCITRRESRMRGCNAEVRPWNAETEVAELCSLDVGLAPLPDDAWTRGKCGLRLLQYLAAGVPTVASPVGMQAEIISRGAALPARREKEWIDSIRRLLSDEVVRRRLIEAGRELIRALYVPDVWWRRVLAAWCGDRALSKVAA